MTMTLKLPAEMEQRLRQRSQRLGLPARVLMREALAAYLDSPVAGQASAYELGQEVFGKYRSGQQQTASQRKAVLNTLWNAKLAQRSHRGCASSGAGDAGGAQDFLRWVQRGAVEIDRPEPASLDHVLAISERFADLPFDLADAAVTDAAARLGIRAVVTVDSDFDVYRDRSGKALTNVLRRQGAWGRL